MRANVEQLLETGKAVRGAEVSENKICISSRQINSIDIML